MTRIAVLGDRDTSLVSHRELDAALALFPAGVNADWLPTEGAQLVGYDAVWLAPGTPYRDGARAYRVIEHARTEGLPLLGTCGGFQYAVVEYARNVAGLDVFHAEIDPDAHAQVIRPLARAASGETRKVTVVPMTRLAAVCGNEPFDGVHFGGYGVNPEYVDALVGAGLTVSAHSDDAGVEAVEVEDHPFFLATLFQPQIGASRGGPLHPLLNAFLAAATSAERTPAA